MLCAAYCSTKELAWICNICMCHIEPWVLTMVWMNVEVVMVVAGECLLWGLLLLRSGLQDACTHFDLIRHSLMAACVPMESGGCHR